QDPSLRARPLVNVRAGRVLHANAAAQQEGILPGLSLAAARLKTAGLHVTTLEAERLHSEWDRQLDELHGWSPHLFSPAPGLAWLLGEPGEAQRLAFEYGVAAGSATSRELALAAARLGVPGEVRAITRGRERQFLAGIR